MNDIKKQLGAPVGKINCHKCHVPLIPIEGYHASFIDDSPGEPVKCPKCGFMGINFRGWLRTISPGRPGIFW